MAKDLRHIDLFYDSADSHESALALILALRPDWEATKDTIDFVRFKDGITNTVWFYAASTKCNSGIDRDPAFQGRQPASGN